MTMKLPKETIESNKATFCELLRTCGREGANIEALIRKLESSDFFTAPASTKYHNNVEGGLCDHSLNVYYNLKSLVRNKRLEDIIPEDSVLICGLLHDMSKMNRYEKYYRNEKVYSEYGTKHDNLGNFDWVAKEAYRVTDIENQFLYGNHEETSEYMIRCYIPLKLEESVAIINHECGMWDDCVPVKEVVKKYDRYPIACLLHTADMISSFVDEGAWRNE